MIAFSFTLCQRLVHYLGISYTASKTARSDHPFKLVAQRYTDLLLWRTGITCILVVRCQLTGIDTGGGSAWIFF